MKVEIITTGTELLLGEILNTNVQYLSRKLNNIGFDVLYHTTVGDNPERMRAVLEQAMQRALIQYRNPKNYDLVMEALKKAHRMDLVGFDKHCLIRPRKFEGRSQQKVPGQKTQNQKSSGKPGRNDRGKNKNEHSRRNTVQSDRQNSRQKKKSIRNVHKKK